VGIAAALLELHLAIVRHVWHGEGLFMGLVTAYLLLYSGALCGGAALQNRRIALEGRAVTERTVREPVTGPARRTFSAAGLVAGLLGGLAILAIVLALAPSGERSKAIYDFMVGWLFMASILVIGRIESPRRRLVAIFAVVGAFPGMTLLLILGAVLLGVDGEPWLLLVERAIPRSLPTFMAGGLAGFLLPLLGWLHAPASGKQGPPRAW